MDLVVANYRETPVPVEITVLPPGADERRDARVFHERTVIPRMAGEEDLWRREAFAPSRRYRIELLLREAGTTSQYRYQPSCSRGEVEDPGVRISINDTGGVRFTQSDCSDGGPFG